MSGWNARSGSALALLFAAPLSIGVALQWLWLLPVLDARAELIIQGGAPEPAPWHALYIGAEVLKLLALLIAGWLTLWRLRSA